MEFAGVPDERQGRSVAARGSSGRRDGRHSRALAAGPAIGEAEPPVSADSRQADYFLHLLAQRRRLIDHRIDEYRKALAASEAQGETEAACNFRRMTRAEEQDRRTLDKMIDELRRRFPRRNVGEPPLAARHRFAAR
ncbi:hypothetical protein [Mycobacterium parmense]|uniref:Uncharacterized protein n=1 Tax=Mycobacterium parmense TaxID=185642 RepID=A0A7I7YV82_9MYCO|nr:hypothetical protein [Mycobacterium parmense]MCV7351888.1 hypothetical protein [Mycobacterium parmense]ORW56714.1 hypothetical protein AWC20_02435 [Mycobacterium parmense]BBZ44641.1 hypothetical protein MPRM_19220 [Mycobacterium parmense]